MKRFKRTVRADFVDLPRGLQVLAVAVIMGCGFAAGLMVSVWSHGGGV